MILYAIYDPSSDLYLTRGFQPKLEEIGINTRFFETQSEAMRHIENRRYESDTTNLQNDLAFWLLENIHGTDRWHIDVSFDEFMDACSQFKKLRVRGICLKEEQQQEEKE